MPNKWVEHVKSWAKRNNETYTCALADPGCKFEYYDKDKKINKKVNYLDIPESTNSWGTKLYLKQEASTPSKKDLKILAEKLSKMKVKDRSMIIF